MVDEKLKSYIKYQLKKGYAKENIKNALLNAGHSLEIIEQHFKSIEEERSKKSNRLTYLVIFFIAVSIFSIFLNFILYSKQNSIQKYDELIVEARQLCDKRDYDNAFKNLKKAVDLDKTGRRSSAYGVMGKCYLQQNNSIDAIKVLKIAVAKNPGEPQHFYGLGTAYCRLGNYNYGIINLLRSIELNPNNSDFYNTTGKCYSKAGNQEEADKYFELANGVTPTNITSE